MRISAALLLFSCSERAPPWSWLIWSRAMCIRSLINLNPSPSPNPNPNLGACAALQLVDLVAYDVHLQPHVGELALKLAHLS